MTNPSSQALKVQELSQNRPTRFSLIPDSSELGALAEELGLLGLRKLRFEGEIKADGKRDWRLDGTLGATVVQPCVVTLAPVTTRIEEPVVRRYLAEIPEESEDEVEMGEDDSIEELGATIDPAAVMIEALALALPLYPRADGAEMGAATYTEPGKEALSDADLKPFAGLAALRDKLAGDDPAEG